MRQVETADSNNQNSEIFWKPRVFSKSRSTHQINTFCRFLGCTIACISLFSGSRLVARLKSTMLGFSWDFLMQSTVKPRCHTTSHPWPFQEEKKAAIAKADAAKRQQKTRPALLKLPKLLVPWGPHPASCHCFHSRSQTKFRALRFLHIPHCKAAKHSEDAQKARKEAEAAHTEKQTALTDAAATKKLGPERMYNFAMNVSSCCEMFHCEVSLCDKLWSLVLTFVGKISQESSWRGHTGSDSESQWGTAGQHGTATVLLVLLCNVFLCLLRHRLLLIWSLEMPWYFDSCWSMLRVIWFTFWFYATRSQAIAAADAKVADQSSKAKQAQDAMEQAEADDHTRLRCSASKNAIQSHALQTLMAFYGTGNFEIVALTLCTWSGSEHEVVHVWPFSLSSLGVSKLHSLHWTWVWIILSWDN